RLRGRAPLAGLLAGTAGWWGPLARRLLTGLGGAGLGRRGLLAPLAGLGAARGGGGAAGAARSAGVGVDLVRLLRGPLLALRPRGPLALARCPPTGRGGGAEGEPAAGHRHAVVAEDEGVGDAGERGAEQRSHDEDPQLHDCVGAGEDADADGARRVHRGARQRD